MNNTQQHRTARPKNACRPLKEYLAYCKLKQKMVKMVKYEYILGNKKTVEKSPVVTLGQQ